MCRCQREWWGGGVVTTEVRPREPVMTADIDITLLQWQGRYCKLPWFSWKQHAEDLQAVRLTLPAALADLVK